MSPNSLLLFFHCFTSLVAKNKEPLRLYFKITKKKHLLGPGMHKILFVPSKSLFPQSCVTSGGSIVGLMVTSSKRAYAIPKSAAPRVRDPVAGHC